MARRRGSMVLRRAAIMARLTMVPVRVVMAQVIRVVTIQAAMAAV